MSQQEQDLPRFVQIIGRCKTLVATMAAVGLLAGIVFAALNAPVFTSRALLAVAPTCPAGAICGGPAFLPAYNQAELLKELPAGVQINAVTEEILSVSAVAGTAAQAEAAADAAARSYIAYADSLSSPGWQAPAPLLEPATTATGTPPLQRLRADALLGAVFGALLGIITALASSGATIDPVAAPRGFDVGEGKGASWPGGQLLIGRDPRLSSWPGSPPS
jgi:hypothetical protein